MAVKVDRMGMQRHASLCRTSLHPALIIGHGTGGREATYRKVHAMSRAVRVESSSSSSVYLDWALQKGVSFQKVTQDVIGGMRGMVAVEDIGKGEIFVELPRSAALVVDPLEKCPCSEFVDAGYYKACSWYVKMSILLLWERQKGASSRIYGYISQLPSSIDTPVRWSEEEVDQLQSVRLKQAVLEQKEEWSAAYKEFQKNRVENATEVTYDDFVWAMENVRSRSFSGPYAGSPIRERLTMAGMLAVVGGGYAFMSHIPLESVLNAGIAVACFNLVYDVVLSSRLKWFAMCPVIDSLNHSGNVTSSIEYEYFKDTFVVSTESSYEKGQQIFISYGKKTNEQLMQYYGFILKDNPHDVYTVVATVNGVEVPLSITQNGQLAEETMTMLEGNDEVRKGVSGSFSDAVNAALIDAVRQELDRKQTSLADDERLCNSPGMVKSARQQIALDFRMSQKTMLTKALTLAEKRQKKR
ncbi:hypothetical protein M9435_000092 [Picochlorum sp. BPE23]|nr:hypothetical protein M9435_000092 [Picochlorum sp. BPE23]